MSAVPKKRYTPAEYLARERTAPTKSEYLNGEIFAMSGASFQHNQINGNVSGNLYGQLRGGPCRAVSSDQRVWVRASGLYTYPDIAIVCEPVEIDEDDNLLNPRALIEVLSPSTEKYDATAKARHYRSIPSLVEHFLVAQREPLVERYVRQPDGTWSLTTWSGLDAVMEFASVPAKIPLADVYERVRFPSPDESSADDVEDPPHPGNPRHIR